MSLLVWLPLNGTLENKGVSPATFSLVTTGGGVSSSSGGKITPNCYKRTTKNTISHITSDINFTLDGDISMACWCKLTGYGTNDSANGIITQHGHLTGGLGITMKYISSTDYRMSINTGLFGDGGGGTNDRTYHKYYGNTNIYNAWHHLCITYVAKTKQLKMYVDGKLETIQGYGTSLTLNGNNTTPRPFRLFDWSTDHSSSATYRPPCLLNDVRLYDHALSLNEIHQLVNGMILHYNFEDGVGEKVYDCSGYENHAKNIGVIEKSDTNIGLHSAYFASTGSQYLTIAEPSLDNTNISISVWWKSNNNKAKNGYHILFATKSPNSSYSSIEISVPDSGQLRWGYVINTTGNRTTNNTTISPKLNNGEWRHIVITYDGQYEKAYVDGKLVDTRTNAGTILYTNSTETYIGKYVTGTYGATDAYISDVKVFNTTLSEQDIKTLYEHTVKITPNQALISNYFIELNDQENIDFLTTPYKNGGWGGNAKIENNELILTATNGWHSFVWLTPEHFKTKNAVLSFEYCFTNKDGWNDGVWVHTTPNTAEFLIGNGPKVYNTDIGIWTSISLPLTNLTDYIGWTLRGADGKRKHIVMRIRNPYLLIDKTNIKIQPTGIISCNGMNQIEKVRIEQHGLLTANEFIEI